MHETLGPPGAMGSLLRAAGGEPPQPTQTGFYSEQEVHCVKPLRFGSPFAAICRFLLPRIFSFQILPEQPPESLLRCLLPTGGFLTSLPEETPSTSGCIPWQQLSLSQIFFVVFFFAYSSQHLQCLAQHMAQSIQ